MPPTDRVTPWGAVLVIMPTFLEADNLERVVDALYERVSGVDLLVVDDASPDGTGEIAERLAAADPRVHVMHRAAKEGLGPAYLAGFDWGRRHGYDVLVEMDADGSHPASALPQILTTLAADDTLGLVIGSRWVAGGGAVDWPRQRLWLSKAANRYARILLRLPVHDITAGYRAYSSTALASIIDGRQSSRGYSFQIDMTIRTFDAGFGIAEVPIIFRDRTAGSSKITRGIIVEAMFRVAGWGISRAVRRVQRPADTPRVVLRADEPS